MAPARCRRRSPPGAGSAFDDGSTDGLDGATTAEALGTTDAMGEPGGELTEQPALTTVAIVAMSAR